MVVSHLGTTHLVSCSSQVRIFLTRTLRVRTLPQLSVQVSQQSLLPNNDHFGHFGKQYSSHLEE